MTVTHIDSHRHVHALPCVWEPVVAVARSAGTRVVRVPVEPPSPTTSRPGNVLKQLVIAASWRIAARRDRGLLRPDHFRGIGLLWAADFAGAVLALVDRLPAGTTELMVHPGYASAAEIEPWDDYVAPRERELAALCSPAFRDALARCGVTLIDFTRL